jgi:hypothetical protein
MLMKTSGTFSLADDPCRLRCDEFLRTSATDALAGSGYPILRQIDCQVNGRIADLHGVVPSFHLKQVAQTVVMRIEDLLAVRNHLRVEPVGERAFDPPLPK